MGIADALSGIPVDRLSEVFPPSTLPIETLLQRPLLSPSAFSLSLLHRLTLHSLITRWQSKSIHVRLMFYMSKMHIKLTSKPYRYIWEWKKTICCHITTSSIFGQVGYMWNRGGWILNTLALHGSECRDSDGTSHYVRRHLIIRSYFCRPLDILSDPETFITILLRGYFDIRNR